MSDASAARVGLTVNEAKTIYLATNFMRNPPKHCVSVNSIVYLVYLLETSEKNVDADIQRVVVATNNWYFRLVRHL